MGLPAGLPASSTFSKDTAGGIHICPTPPQLHYAMPFEELLDLRGGLGMFYLSRETQREGELEAGSWAVGGAKGGKEAKQQERKLRRDCVTVKGAIASAVQFQPLASHLRAETHQVIPTRPQKPL